MSESGGFHDLLFELSNENRYNILLLLQKNAKRITHITSELNLMTSETRRHVSRLSEVGLIQRDIEGYYHLTSFGEMVLISSREFDFMSRNKDYLISHNLAKIPKEYHKQISELAESKEIDNPMDFLHQSEKLFKESKRSVCLIVDQFPVYSISAIIEAIDRGVQFKIIEPKDRVLNPNFNHISSEEEKALSRARYMPLVEQRMLDKSNVYMCLSEDRCVFAFPTSDGQFDYKGFTSTDPQSLKWCEGLFNHYWGESQKRNPITPSIETIRGRVSEKRELDQIVVIGRDSPEYDAQAVQDAVDFYAEVILKGKFNLGVSSILISRSVTIKGEGRENDIPLTTIYKKGWSFPFREFDSVFKIDNESADVTIENLHFTDFNHTCIWGEQCNSLNIKKNWITLMTGYGRGIVYGAFGDGVIGIWIRGSELQPFNGSVTIEGNYINFARGGAWGGFLSRDGLEEDPFYRPDLFNHEYYMGFGIAVNNASNRSHIENNEILNTNARGIAVTDNHDLDVCISDNRIVSNLYGSYPFSSAEAGAGILVQSAWGHPGSGSNIMIEDNFIKFEKLNYCGIKILGPVINQKGVEKLRGGVVRNNRIELKNGYEGVHIRKCDDFEVTSNTISGMAYYGVRISGRKREGELDLTALSNKVEDNDMSALHIKDPDAYSDEFGDGRRFAGSIGESVTAHIWLGRFSIGNVIKIEKDQAWIDEGESNKIIIV